MSQLADNPNGIGNVVLYLIVTYITMFYIWDVKKWNIISRTGFTIWAILVFGLSVYLDPDYTHLLHK